MATGRSAEQRAPTSGSARGLSSGSVPLAVRMRPTSIDEIAGQGHLLGRGSPLVSLATGDAEHPGGVSVILWGPPGTGKTTIAQAIARSSGREFVELSAVTAGVKDVREVMERALAHRDLYGTTTVLFLDEIHRFSKAQQDALLPGVENGWVILIAATTENPSFSVISPLLSRSLLLTLKPLTDTDLGLLIDRAVEDPRGLGGSVVLGDEARAVLVRLASGDARRALTALEAAAQSALASADAPAAPDTGADVDGDVDDGADGVVSRDRDEDEDEDEDEGDGSLLSFGDAGGDSATADTVPVITAETIAIAVDRALLRYDRQGDEHYDVISAFIKSIRGSDVDASLHYLARMVEAGEDPRFIARRIIISASEDIGMADPQALPIAVAAAQAVQLIGMPEGRIPLAEAVVYLATAPKSNASYNGINAAIADVRAGRMGVVPNHLRDAHYPGAKRLGHGRGYVYSHDADHGVARQQYLPDALDGTEYYTPTANGNEREVGPRLERLRRIIRGE